MCNYKFHCLIHHINPIPNIPQQTNHSIHQHFIKSNQIPHGNISVIQEPYEKTR